MENLGEQVENREQQIQQLARHEEKAGGEEEERRFREVDSQFQALKAENKQLRVRTINSHNLMYSKFKSD